jgi:hypothetical protein
MTQELVRYEYGLPRRVRRKGGRHLSRWNVKRRLISGGGPDGRKYSGFFDISTLDAGAAVPRTAPNSGVGGDGGGR